MNYEKKYKNALEWARQVMNGETGFIRKEVEEVFPELRESEDEKIRKVLIGWINLEPSTSFNDTFDGFSKEQILAWLEKQDEQKSIWHNEDKEPKRGSLILLIMQSGTPIVAKIIEPNHTFNHGERWAYIDDLLEKQGEQKPAWSEEDEREVAVLEAYIRSKDWSESHIDRALGIVDELVNKVKSFRNQNTWRPSDVQMELLKEACDQHWEPDGLDPLYTLYQDLKKLKG